MIEEEIIGSHTGDDSKDEQGNAMGDALKAFGLDIPNVTTEEEVKEGAPAIEQKTEPVRIEKVKHNKEEKEVDISTTEKLHDHLQRSLALDKERDRRNELEKNLDRAARLAGFKDHTEYAANLDRIEQEQQQRAHDQFEQAKQKIIDDLIYNGVDEQVAREYAENNPLIQQARVALEEKNIMQQKSQQQTAEAQRLSEWDLLYKTFPEAEKTAKEFAEGRKPDWYTPEMESKILQGYKPIDAYKLAHMDKIQTQTKKATEQRLIKEQHLGIRSRVETISTPDNEPQVPKALSDAFAAFGLPAESAKKYIKK